MDISALRRDDDAVSSVLGVVLMVAVTIILAAVIGTFVLGIGQDLTDESPTTTFDYGFDVEDDPSTNSSITILHGGGDALDRGTIEVTIDGKTAYESGSAGADFAVVNDWPEQVTAGDRLEIQDTNGQGISTGATVRIIWSSGDTAAIISDQQIS